MAVVQFPTKTKYDGVWQPPHTPFKVRKHDVLELVSSGAVVLADEDEEEDKVPETVETEEEKQERLIAEAKAEEERLAAEEAAATEEQDLADGAEPPKTSRAKTPKEK